jgi:hypothetical protein
VLPGCRAFTRAGVLHVASCRGSTLVDSKMGRDGLPCRWAEPARKTYCKQSVFPVIMLSYCLHCRLQYRMPSGRMLQVGCCVIAPMVAPKTQEDEGG